MMWGQGWDNWFLGFLMMLVFWGGLVAIVVLVLRSRDADRRPGGPTAGRSDARAILEERFARGEISEDEFEQRRRVLERAAH